MVSITPQASLPLPHQSQSDNNEGAFQGKLLAGYRGCLVRKVLYKHSLFCARASCWGQITLVPSARMWRSAERPGDSQRPHKPPFSRWRTEQVDVQAIDVVQRLATPRPSLSVQRAGQRGWSAGLNTWQYDRDAWWGAGVLPSSHCCTRASPVQQGWLRESRIRGWNPDLELV